MLKNISKLGKTLSNDELKNITGGFPGDASGECTVSSFQPCQVNLGGSGLPGSSCNNPNEICVPIHNGTQNGQCVCPED